MTRTPLIIAHRGDSARALENSMEAFKLALSVPVDMIEFDVRRSADGVLFVMHDEQTGRTCNTDLNIEKSMAADIAKVRLKNGENIPLFQDVLALVAGRAGLNIEIKSEGAGVLVAETIVEYGYHGDILISSFNEQELLHAETVLPNGVYAGIFDDFSSTDILHYSKRGYRVVSLNKRTVSQDLIEKLHKRGIRVYVWTVDSANEINKLISLGVDGIYSNKPAVLKSIVTRTL